MGIEFVFVHKYEQNNMHNNTCMCFQSVFMGFDITDWDVASPRGMYLKWT